MPEAKLSPELRPLPIGPNTAVGSGNLTIFVVDSAPMYFDFVTDPDHVKRERRKAQELRQSSWWKQQVGPGRCYHCGERVAKELLTMDHVIPVARGGKSTKKNCVPSCKACNTEKGALLSVERTFLEMASAQNDPKLPALS